MTHERRWRALLLSALLCPGAGQLLLGRRGRGALMMALSLGLTGALLGGALWWTWGELVGGVPLEDPLAVPHAFGLALAHHRAVLVIGSVVLVAVWLWSAADALWGRAPRSLGRVARASALPESAAHSRPAGTPFGPNAPFISVSLGPQTHARHRQ